MLKIKADVIENYIKGKDLNRPEILETIYSEKSKVIFSIQPSTIAFPSEISGNIEIAKVLSKDFNKRYEKVRTYYLKDDSEEIAYQMLSCCVLCPRQCKANRLVGETGVCGTGSLVRIASFGPQFGEEQPLVGSHGSVPSLWQRSSFSKTGSFDQSFGVSGSTCFCQTCRLNKN